MASVLGPMIPPSITLIVYASLTESSVPSLFKASIIPGVLLCALLIIYGLVYGEKRICLLPPECPVARLYTP